MNGTCAIVLAAGQGTRMKSDLPKVLVPVCGRPMIDYVLDMLAEAKIERVIVEEVNRLANDGPTDDEIERGREAGEADGAEHPRRGPGTRARRGRGRGRG